MWLYVSLEYATFAIGSTDGEIVDQAPPIAKWAIGKRFEDVADYYRRKGADVLERRNAP